MHASPTDSTASVHDLATGHTPLTQSSDLGSLLTVTEVADYLRVSEMTVYRLISSRRIGASKIGRSWRIPVTDVRAYVEQQHVPRAS